MKAGDIVMIYADPLTQNHPEGEAKLVEFLSKTELLESWEVEFENEKGEIYLRQI